MNKELNYKNMNKELNYKLNVILSGILIISDIDDYDERLKLSEAMYDDLSKLKIELTGYDGFEEYIEKLNEDISNGEDITNGQDIMFLLINSSY
jgi:hypothetical protein